MHPTYTALFEMSDGELAVYRASLTGDDPHGIYRRRRALIDAILAERNPFDETLSDGVAIHYPHHFSAREVSGDSMTLDGWNEDNTGEVTLNLTRATALDLVATVTAVLAANPYNR